MALGVHAVNPVNGEKVPCFVAPYVLMEYGTGAIMAVPGHDERDFAFARAHGLPVRVVIQPDGVETLDGDTMPEAYAGEGVMVNSGPFDGERTPGSIAKVAAWLADEGRGEAAVTFRLRDWLLSRQRYWGAPIPIVHCDRCGEVAVPEAELPVLLPDDVDFQPGGESPLARHPSWSKVVVSHVRRRRAARHRHDGHVRRLVLVLLPVLLAGLRGRSVPTRGRGPVDAGQPVHRRRGARDPAPALHPLLHEGAVRHGHGRVHRAVPAPDEPGPGDLRRRLHVQDQGQHRRADAARGALGRRHDAPRSCCSRARSRTTSTGS